MKMSEVKWAMQRGRAHNPFAGLVLDNIRDEKGKPVRVNSELELRAAEKKYNFVHAASWGMESTPPQHEKWAGDIHHGREPKFNRDPSAYGGDHVEKVELGGSLTPDATLADLPNSTREVGT